MFITNKKIICSIATMSSRLLALKDTVNAILPQVDELIIVQDNYHRIPNWLKHDKITVISLYENSKADGNKYYLADKYDDVYWLTLDDDLIPTPNYVEQIITGLNKYDDKAIVSFHGRIMKDNPISYYFDASQKYMCLKTEPNDVKIQFPGTGVTAIATKNIKFNFNNIKYPRMCDIELGIYAKQYNIPVIMLQHEQGIVTHNETKYDERLSIGMEDHPHETYQKIRLKDWLNINTQPLKFVLLGSAPHAKEYWDAVKEKYLKNDYKLVAINNAWSIDPDNLHRWYIPNDFLNGAGTIIPTKQQQEEMNIIHMPNRVEGYLPPWKGSTMSINVMHLLLNEYQANIELVVIGSDFIYKKNEDTHFYGKGKKLEYVEQLMKRNNPEYQNLAADPLRMGTDWLITQLNHVQDRYNQSNSKIYVDTPSETLLPFKHK